MGYIKQGSAPGTYCLLSLAQRSLDKLVSIVEKELKSVGAQRISLPALTLGELWKTSGNDNNY
jgi:prolyl-tRNA synthetase